MKKRYYPTTMEALALTLLEEKETPPEMVVFYIVMMLVLFISIPFLL